MSSVAVGTSLLDLFLPRCCLGCGDRIPPEEPRALVCERCRSMLRPLPPPRCLRCHLPLGTGGVPGEVCTECERWPVLLQSARSAVVMEPPADALVHALKYGGWSQLGELMGRRMVPLLPRYRGGSVVVPVPTTPRRRRLRGYNQARILAEVVARERSLPLLDLLERREGRTQVRLTPAERRSNVRGSFVPRPAARSRIRGMGVILIDDVLTTGATGISAALALGEAGAEVVHLVTFARALPFGRERGRVP